MVTIMAAGKVAYQVATDDQGAFHIEGVKEGYYTANFVKSNFLPPARTGATGRQFHVAAGSDPIRLQAQLTPMSKISGHVFDAAGHALSGASLLLEGSRVGDTTTSDQQGYFLLLGPPRRLHVEREASLRRRSPLSDRTTSE